MSAADAPLTTATAVELASAIADGETSARDVIDAHLARIEETDEDVAAYLVVTADGAREAADAIDRRRRDGEALGPLAGVPLAVKDVFCTEGVVTTAGSRILQGWVPPYTATAVALLEAAGAIVVGKTNMDEFAMGSSTENSAWGPSRNPWDLGRVPGGSSGGSSATVAAHQVPLAIGTDTGGSIRQPAALCGLVGVKPTYGRVSRWGMIAFASSLDQAGPFTRTVADAAVALQVMAGHDPLDSTSLPTAPADFSADLDRGVEGLRIGVVREFLDTTGLDAEVRATIQQALARYEALGAELVDASLPHGEYGINAYYLIAPAECSSNLARFDGVRFGLRVEGETTEEMMAATRAAGFGAEVKRRVMIGTHALSAGYYDAYYAQAQRVRTLIARDFTAAFGTCDVLVGPTSPTTAFALGDKTDDPLAMYLNDVFTIPSSLAGTPSLSLPAGFDEAGLPVGLQVMAPLDGEAVMLRAAAALEADLALDLVPRGPRAVSAPG